MAEDEHRRDVQRVRGGVEGELHRGDALHRERGQGGHEAGGDEERGRAEAAARAAAARPTARRSRPAGGSRSGPGPARRGRTARPGRRAATPAGTVDAVPSRGAEGSRRPSEAAATSRAPVSASGQHRRRPVKPTGRPGADGVGPRAARCAPARSCASLLVLTVVCRSYRQPDGPVAGIAGVTTSRGRSTSGPAPRTRRSTGPATTGRGPRRRRSTARSSTRCRSSARAAQPSEVQPSPLHRAPHPLAAGPRGPRRRRRRPGRRVPGGAQDVDLAGQHVPGLGVHEGAAARARRRASRARSPAATSGRRPGASRRPSPRTAAFDRGGDVELARAGVDHRLTEPAAGRCSRARA